MLSRFQSIDNIRHIQYYYIMLYNCFDNIEYIKSSFKKALTEFLSSAISIK